uniref:H15 domain-containing protein n=1 Tax=Macrostomum lignano TaxID=282301 RepID=A0A1I8JMB9_9PLAT
KHRKAKKSVPKPGSSKASLPPKKPKKIKKIVRHLGIKAAERKRAKAASLPPRLQCLFSRLVMIGVSSGSFRTLGGMASTPAAASARMVISARPTSPAVVGPVSKAPDWTEAKSGIGRRGTVEAGALSTSRYAMAAVVSGELGFAHCHFDEDFSPLGIDALQLVRGSTGLGAVMAKSSGTLESKLLGKNNKKIAKAPQVIVGGSESSLAPQFRKKNRKAKKSVPKPGSSNASLPPRKPKKNKKKQKKRKILFRHVRTGGDESSTSTGSGTPRKVNIGKKKRIQKHKAGGSGVKKTGGSASKRRRKW